MNEDDLWALHDLEAKRHRVHRGAVIYLQVCTLVTILVLLGVLAGIIVWTMWPILLPLVFAWALFIPGPVLVLVNLVFKGGKGINKKSLEKCEERTYTFFEDHFTIEEKNSTTKNRYSVMTKFAEKGDRFFVFIDVNVAYVIRKSCFLVGTPEDFGPFMREKYRTKDMDTPEKGLDRT